VLSAYFSIVLVFLLYAVILSCINGVTQYVIIALNRQRTLTVAFGVVAIFNIAANLIFIPRYSYPAAAVVTILSEFVLWGVFYVVLISELGRVNWLRTLWRIISPVSSPAQRRSGGQASTGGWPSPSA
jgi:O-antigen/teichoic acid export membrane protein